MAEVLLIHRDDDFVHGSPELSGCPSHDADVGLVRHQPVSHRPRFPAFAPARAVLQHADRQFEPQSWPSILNKDLSTDHRNSTGNTGMPGVCHRRECRARMPAHRHRAHTFPAPRHLHVTNSTQVVRSSKVQNTRKDLCPPPPGSLGRPGFDQRVGNRERINKPQHMACTSNAATCCTSLTWASAN